MSSLVPWLIGLGLMALLVVVIVVSRRKERERTEAMERVCIEMGFVFEPQADIDLLTSLGDLPLYKRGHSRRAKNMMTGRVGDDAVKVVNFQYTTGGGQHQHTSKQTVAVFPQVTRSLPDLQLAPENVFHKLGQVFGYQDIDFESNPDFSSRYLVRGPDETAIRAALYPETLSFFAEHEGWTVEIRSGTVGIYRAGQRSKPEDVRTFLEEAREVLRSLRRG
jgi:hypothetical protein